MKNDKLYNQMKPYLAVILLQFGYAGMTIISKCALNQGMSSYTFVVYRNGIAALAFAPFALFLERKKRPTMTISVFARIMLLGLLEPVIDQNLYYTGMKYTTATFSVAMCNILPAVTFLMAWALRMEKVNIRRLHSQAKIGGTIGTVGGAMIMTLIKGPIIGLPWTNGQVHAQAVDTTTEQDHIKGSVMIAVGCVCWAAFFILQARTLKVYPAELSLTTLICLLGSLQGAVLTFVVEKGNTAIWAISWDTKFIAAAYSGIVCSGIGYYVSGMVMKERGPVFVTAFNPLRMVIVGIMGSFILAEQLFLGRAIGMGVIVIGLYVVIWGKSKDHISSSSIDDEVLVLPIDEKMAAAATATATAAKDNKPTKMAASSEQELVANVSEANNKPADEAV